MTDTAHMNEKHPPFMILDDYPSTLDQWPDLAAHAPVALPASIRVGYRHYQVIDWDHKEANGDRAYGTHNAGLGNIRVACDLDPEKKANTLLHEVLHACYNQMALGDGAEEESVVLSLSNALCQVWQDNPDLVAFLDAALGSRRG